MIFKIYPMFTALTADEPIYKALVIPAPAKPPISVCDELDGIPNHQVIKFQLIAAMRPASSTGIVTKCSTTILDTVLATLWSLMKKNTMKLKAAAQRTAWNGVNTFVEVGPGKVLSGLMRQINRDASCLNVEDSASLEAARARLNSWLWKRIRNWHRSKRNARSRDRE